MEIIENVENRAIREDRECGEQRSMERKECREHRKAWSVE